MMVTKTPMDVTSSLIERRRRSPRRTQSRRNYDDDHHRQRQDQQHQHDRQQQQWKVHREGGGGRQRILQSNNHTHGRRGQRQHHCSYDSIKNDGVQKDIGNMKGAPHHHHQFVVGGGDSSSSSLSAWRTMTPKMLMMTTFMTIVIFLVVIVLSSSITTTMTSTTTPSSSFGSNIPHRLDPDGFLHQILPRSAFAAGNSHHHADKNLYDNFQYPYMDSNIYPCQPRKIHLAQKSDVGGVGGDNDSVVNMIVSFTVDRDMCSPTNVTTMIVYGKEPSTNVFQRSQSQQQSRMTGFITNFVFGGGIGSDGSDGGSSFRNIVETVLFHLGIGSNTVLSTDKDNDDSNDHNNNDNHDNDDYNPPYNEIVHFDYNSPVTGPGYKSDYIHHVTLPDLEVGSRYWYRILVVKNNDNDSSNINNNNQILSSSPPRTFFSLRGSYRWLGETKTYTFPTPPPSYKRTSRKATAADRDDDNHYDRITPPTTLALVGDLGQTENSTKTMFNIMKSDATSVLIAGDLSYADGDPYRWESWLELMEPLLRSMPLASIPGNHEIECDNVTHQVFTPYESYFRNPNRLPMKPDRQPPSDEYRKTLWEGSCRGPSEFLGHYNFGNAFTSFRHGMAHIIMLNSYTDVNSSSVQYDWLQNQAFPSVDREVTPWLIVMFHTPLYTTFLGHNDEINSINLRKSVEDLLLVNHVNIVVSGHDHAYMRTKPMYQSKPNPDGPIYLTLGAGGNREQHTRGFIHPDKPEPWIVKRENDEYGFGLLKMYNSTHSHLSWRRDHTCTSGDACIRDNVWIENSIFSSKESI